MKNEETGDDFVPAQTVRQLRDMLNKLPESYLDKPITISAVSTTTTLRHVVNCVRDEQLIIVGNR